MDHIAEIRRRHFISGENISEISRSLSLSRPTVRKALQSETEPVYQRRVQPTPKLGDFKDQLTGWLVFDINLPKRRRRTAQRLFECLQVEGYQGSYGPVQRFVLDWKRRSGKQPIAKQAFVPLVFPAGETCQFDWSYEYVVLGGVLQTIKVAHFRLSYSRKMFLVAYPRETQEMVLDAHIRAFSYFGGVPKRMIYDNLKTVVDAIFVGKERQFNRRFLTLANHYLFEPVACTPESGWEKGQVENQVGNVREWLCTPTPKFAGFTELNAWLALRCEELARRRHPEQTGQTIADCFAEEQPLLIPIKAVFDGYVEKTMRVSSTCLVKIDHNRYSVPADWANRVVSVRLTANRLRLVADGQVIAEHDRCYGRSQLLCDPWHLCPLWVLFADIREKARGTPEWRTVPAMGFADAYSDRQGPYPQTGQRRPGLCRIAADTQWAQVARGLGETGLETLEIACDLTLQTGVIAAAIVLNEMRRLTEAARPKALSNMAPTIPILQVEVHADCSRYDSLRSRYEH